MPRGRGCGHQPERRRCIRRHGHPGRDCSKPGTSTVVVYDRLGVSTKFDLTVSGTSESASLYTTAPEAFFMPSNATATYKIAGGLGPYTVTTANLAIVTGTVEGGVLRVKSNCVAGKTALNIRDAKGALVVFTANVSGDSAVPLYTTAPSSISIGLGDASAYNIHGGVGPFTATSSNASVAKASVTGNTLNITGLNAGRGRRRHLRFDWHIREGICNHPGRRRNCAAVLEGFGADHRCRRRHSDLYDCRRRFAVHHDE